MEICALGIFMNFEKFRNFDVERAAFREFSERTHVFITLSTFKRHARCMNAAAQIENEVRKLRRLYLVIPMRLSRVVSLPTLASIGEQNLTASKARGA